jgi:hypothetical protein
MAVFIWDLPVRCGAILQAPPDADKAAVARVAILD